MMFDATELRDDILSAMRGMAHHYEWFTYDDIRRLVGREKQYWRGMRIQTEINNALAQLVATGILKKKEGKLWWKLTTSAPTPSAQSPQIEPNELSRADRGPNRH